MGTSRWERCKQNSPAPQLGRMGLSRRPYRWAHILWISSFTSWASTPETQAELHHPGADILDIWHHEVPGYLTQKGRSRSLLAEAFGPEQGEGERSVKHPRARTGRKSHELPQTPP